MNDGPNRSRQIALLIAEGIDGGSHGACDSEWGEELIDRLTAALTDAERIITEQATTIERIESAYSRLNRAQLRTLELDREFLQQVADSYGIRTDEVTEAFLARAAEAILNA